MPATLALHYQAVREATLRLSQPLSEADMTIQAADFASPGKWHLAHTTWFFEEFLLRRRGLQTSHADTYRFLFNSYYDTIGKRQPQGRRGVITRPSLAEVMEYRRKIDAAVLRAMEYGLTEEETRIVTLGLQHEQQHQELFLTDILYNLAQNPLFPAYRESSPTAAKTSPACPLRMVDFASGLYEVGHTSCGFGYDNEFPRHKVYLEPFRLANRPVTNGEWIAFIEDGGYRNPLLWLSDGWKTVVNEGWEMPLYWFWVEDDYFCMSLAGSRCIDRLAPVCHISYFEADAFARWAQKRLPREEEWEVAASQVPVTGHFVDDHLHPIPAENQEGLQQLYGDVWEWTASPYVAYPRYKLPIGAVGEYNGKFMSGQYVLRGGSCVTPAGHIRASYRNFFYPSQRWQFSGIRLAEDA